MSETSTAPKTNTATLKINDQVKWIGNATLAKIALIPMAPVLLYAYMRSTATTNEQDEKVCVYKGKYLECSFEPFF